MLHTTMESLETNTNYPCEVIVVDNGKSIEDSNYLLGLVDKGVINTYVRNKNNMYFGWAWNQGARMATGKYLCYTCNDIEFYPDWLKKTIQPLIKHPDKRYIATPIIGPEKDNPKYMREPIDDGYRTNRMSGSNCMLMTRKTADHLGELNTSRTASYLWYRGKIIPEEWLMVSPPENMIHHIANAGGVNINADIKVIKILLNGEEVDYSTKVWNEKIPIKT